ncbi:MAG TPA: hypothetical protein VF148_03750 [Acidimicrobiia bacterium]
MGIVEIAAGIGVWLGPKIFAYVVAVWLGVIIIILIIAEGFWGHRPPRPWTTPRRPGSRPTGRQHA